MAAKSVLEATHEFASEWKKDFRKELLLHHNRRNTEKYLSDKDTEFKFVTPKVNRKFVTKNRRLYYQKRHLENGLLFPLWEFLAHPNDSNRTLDEHKQKAKSYTCNNDVKKNDTEGIDDEDIYRAVLFMIATLNPKVKIPRKCTERNSRRIPTHRRNGELYLNGRTL